MGRKLLIVKVIGHDITKYTVTLSAIVLVGTVLRIYQLGAQNLWFDEAFSVFVAKMSVPQLIQATAADTHPPFYYLILHYWMSVFGDSEVVVRLLSALCGILALPLIYLVGRQLFDKEAGLAAALILALSSFNVQYSQETRMYTLMVLLALFSMYFFLRFFQDSSLTLSLGYVLSTTLMLYTHLYGWFVLIAQNIYVVTLLVLSKDRTFRARHWIIVQAIVIALFVPWIPFFVRQTSRVLAGQPVATLGIAVFTAPPPTAGDILQTFTMYAGTTLLLALFLGLSALSLFTYTQTHGSMNRRASFEALTTCSRGVRIGNTAAWLLALWLLIVNLVPFAISRVSVTIYSYKYTIAASVALYLLVAGGIRNLNHKYAKVAVIGVIIVLSAAPLLTYYATPTTPIARPNGSGALSFIDAHARSGDTVIVFPVYHIVVADYYSKRTDIDLKSFGASQKSIAENVKELNASLTGSERVWFIYTDSGNSPLKTQILKTFNESYETASLTRFHGYHVYLFVKRG